MSQGSEAVTAEPLGPEAFGPLAREHLAQPRNLGHLPESEKHEALSGEAGSRVSGDFVRFLLVVRAGRVAVARYQVLGSPALIAVASYLSERLIGLEPQPEAVPPGLALAGELGLPRSEHGAALLAEDAARSALAGSQDNADAPSRE